MTEHLHHTNHDHEVDEVIFKAVYSVIKDMSFSEIRELTTDSYMEIRIKMQNDSETEGEA